MKVLYFTATWCGPCKIFKPLVEEVSSTTGVNINYIDVDADKDTTMKYSVVSVPTLIIMNEAGESLYRHSGLMSKPDLTTFLNRAK